jgi:aryl-alcohol dehydrogenase-like predicted oxidoreductase
MTEIIAERISRLLSKPTGPLGFGCGLLQTGQRRAASVRLLQTAFDLGVRYFDTARLYALGEAERMLGEALGRRRDEAIVVSKVGILPNQRSLAKRVLDRAAVLARAAPPLRAIVPAPQPATPVFGAFDLPRLRASVETSLRELRTDYLDVLLLHECTPENAADSEIRAFLDQLKTEGKIRACGVAPTIEAAIAIQNGPAPFGAVVQFASSAWEDNIGRVPLRPHQVAVVHSLLGAKLRKTLERLRTDEQAAARWRKLLDVDPSDSAAIAQLASAYVLRRNAGGVALFSTNNVGRLHQDLRAAEPALFSDAQLENLPAALRAL